MSEEMSGGKLLGREEEEIIRKTWDIMAKDLRGHGGGLFIHFFTGYPEYQRAFRGFADIPLDKLATNKRLIAHGYTVMNAINGLVDNLDDPEILTELLLKTGQNHIKRNLKVGDFQNLKESLLEYFAKTLGDDWTLEADEAWKKVLSIIVSTIGEGLSSLD